ncbi:hypothetical protein [Shinella zoogloeoides]|uniref:hypothetical protein n=1 Tax=Shinella zoogloeoides TaxID=352475 RepID=UPI00299D37DD|nr:hypothetical protein [Shinella zoogloeoides]
MLRDIANERRALRALPFLPQPPKTTPLFFKSVGTSRFLIITPWSASCRLQILPHWKSDFLRSLSHTTHRLRSILLARRKSRARAALIRILNFRPTSLSSRPARGEGKTPEQEVEALAAHPRRVRAHETCR